MVMLTIGCSKVQLMSAGGLEKAGDNVAAVTIYDQVASVDPDSPSARKAMLATGDLYYDKLDRKAEAVRIYSRIIRNHPGTDEAYEASRKLGFHYYNARDYQKAREMFFALLNDHPKGELGIDVQWKLSECYERLQDPRRAAASYYAFALLHPKHAKAAEALLRAGEIYRQKLKLESKAAEVYKRIARIYGRNPTAAEEVRIATAELKDMNMEVPSAESQLGLTLRQPRRKERVDTFAVLTQAHVESGSIFDEVDTDSIFKAAMAASPGGGLGGGEESKVDPRNTILTLANMYYTYMDYLEAGAFYYILVTRKSDDPQIYWNLGDCYAKLGLIKKAMETYAQAIKMSSNMVDRAITRAESEYSMRDYAEAVGILDLVKDIAPSHKLGKIFYDMGLAYRKMNCTSEALESFERSVAADPTANNKDAAQHIAELLYYRGTDRIRAEIYQDIVEDKVRSFKVQSELACLCSRHGSYRWARIKYKTAAELSEDAETALSMNVEAAIATARAGDCALADSELTELLAKNGDSAVVWYGIGEIAKERKDLDAAIAAFEKSLQLNPNYEPSLLSMRNCRSAREDQE